MPELSCNACGRDNRADSKFCLGCGGALSNACPSCGRELPADAGFCDGCGHRLGVPDASEGSTALGTGSGVGSSSSSGSTITAPGARSSTHSASDLPAAFASGRYRVGRFLGEGAKKRVHLARDMRLDCDVALALIKTEGLDEAGRARVQREAQAMAQLGDHPNIVPVFDIGEEAGHLYIVSQFLSGRRCGPAVCRKQPPSAPPFALDEASARHRSDLPVPWSTLTATRLGAPRPQARQRLAHRGRHRQARRLRAGGLPGPLSPHSGRHDRRHGRRTCRPNRRWVKPPDHAQRPVCGGCDVLRDCSPDVRPLWGTTRWRSSPSTSTPRPVAPSWHNPEVTPPGLETLVHAPARRRPPRTGPPECGRRSSQGLQHARSIRGR